MSSAEDVISPDPPPAPPPAPAADVGQLFAATKGVHDLLAPLAPDLRLRVVRSVFELLGSPLSPTALDRVGGNPSGRFADACGGGERSAAVRQWMRRHGVSDEALDRHFHRDGERTAVIDSPKATRTKKEQVANAYLLQGVAALLSTGVAAFTDDEARDLCRQLGCFDSTNHSKAYKDFGNRLIGSLGDGWRLTNPGLQAAADLLKGGPG